MKNLMVNNYTVYKVTLLCLLISILSVVGYGHTHADELPTTTSKDFTFAFVPSGINYQIDLGEWYQIAADTIGIDVAELIESEDTIKTVANANGSTPRAVIKAIFAVERAELGELRNDGYITRDQYLTRRNEIKVEIQDFVRTEYDSSTDTATQAEQWGELGLDTYTYDLQQDCFCYGFREFTVHVIDGEVSTIYGYDGDAVAIILDTENGVDASELFDVNLDRFRTMEGWFEYIAEQEARDPFALTAQFDPTLGYLTSTYTDYHEMMADDEIGYTISNFR